MNHQCFWQAITYKLWLLPKERHFSTTYKDTATALKNPDKNIVCITPKLYTSLYHPPAILNLWGIIFLFVLHKVFWFAHTGGKTRFLPEGEQVNSLEVANLKLLGWWIQDIFLKPVKNSNFCQHRALIFKRTLMARSQMNYLCANELT